MEQSHTRLQQTSAKHHGARPPVAIINSMDDVIDMLKFTLDLEGFDTVTARLADIQDGRLDLVAFAEEHQPAVIVYDIPLPYEANWNFLRLLKDTMSLRDRGWVLTTTNKAALEAAVGPQRRVVEIILGKPYTLDDVTAAVHRALDGHGKAGHK